VLHSSRINNTSSALIDNIGHASKNNILYRKGSEKMTILEQQDWLIQQLTDFYTIESANIESNSKLEYRIRETETRLKLLGFTNLSDLRPNN